MSKPEPLRVTDHAVLRYLERVKGFDVESVRTHIRTICTASAAAGATSYKAEGVKFAIGNHSVITVEPNSPLPSRTQQARSRSKVQASL